MYSRIQLLVVDDDAAERERTCTALSAGDLDAQIVAVGDLPEALARLRAQPFDCVLTEHQLPRGDGLMLFRATRELGVECPFIVLTNPGHEQVAVELMKAGAADYLIKAESTPEQLGQAVRQATRVRHAERLRAEAQERQRKYATQLKGLADASIAINSATSLERLLQVLSQKAAQLIGAHQAATGVIPDGDWTQARSAACLSDKYARYGELGAPGERPYGRVIYEQVCASNLPVRMSVRELHAHLRAAGAAHADDEPPLLGCLAAPLVSRAGQNLGFVLLSDKYDGEFGEDDEAVLLQLARFASLSVENAHLLALEKRARQHAEASAARIARLQAVTAALSRSASTSEVMNIIVEQAEISLDADQVALYAVGSDGSTLSLRAHRNMQSAAIAQITELRTDQPFLTAKSVRERRMLFVDSLADYAREAAGAAQVGIWTANTQSVVCLPLQLGGSAPFGTIAMSFVHRRMLSESDRSYLESLADQWAQAFDRARLHEAEHTARKQAEQAREQAETANRLKDEFLATISHELRTPLQSMLGWARLLRGHALDARTNKGLEIIERNARAQAQLIEDILDVSRIITGKLRLSPRTVSIEQFVQAAVDTLRAAAEAKHIDLRTSIAPNAGDIVGDPDRLQQVVWNLLSNAVKFTPESGRIDVQVTRTEEHVAIRVTDSGKGIPSAFLPHVFERFRQADATTTRAHSGLGLGLAIVRHLTELHGGRVVAESDGPERGASFTVQLPAHAALPQADRDDAPSVAATPISASDLTVSLAKRRVLVVDDEPDARELTAAVLTQAGAQVSSAISAAEALEKLQQFAPDLVVSDISMPGEDGFSLLARIRALEPPLGAVPVVALTAFARPEDRERMLRAGFALHLAKPVDPQVLLSSLASMLSAV